MFATAANAQAIRIGTEGAYEPWNYVDANGNLAGLDIDVMNELCKRAGLECTFVQTAWDTIIPNLNAGNYDVIAAGMSITDERKQSINFTADYSPPESVELHDARRHDDRPQQPVGPQDRHADAAPSRPTMPKSISRAATRSRPSRRPLMRWPT